LPNFILNRSCIGVLQAQKKHQKPAEQLYFGGGDMGVFCCTDII